MPKCQWREKPGLEPVCAVLPDAGAEMCPRHAFLDAQRKQGAANKEAAKQAVAGLGLKGPGPRTRAELLQRGYVFTGSGACRGCGAAIEWYRTPNLRTAPYNQMPHDASFAVSHYATCKQAQHFRRAS